MATKTLKTFSVEEVAKVSRGGGEFDGWDADFEVATASPFHQHDKEGDLVSQLLVIESIRQHLKLCLVDYR